MKTIAKYLITICSIILFTSTSFASASEKTEPGDLYYVLLFKWKTDAPIGAIEEVDTLWHGLVDNVEGLKGYELIELTTGDYDHMVVLIFASEAAKKAYHDHKDHARIAAIGPEIVERFSSFSYLK
ncbi:MAG: Dabb family protein [Imperialibacter sp.]|uniref:Dabb family protein n=1 Tax=Imperialibacter sp. TaxID=2038411 RepID=UPI0032EB766D